MQNKNNKYLYLWNKSQKFLQMSFFCSQIALHFKWICGNWSNAFTFNCYFSSAIPTAIRELSHLPITRLTRHFLIRYVLSHWLAFNWDSTSTNDISKKAKLCRPHLITTNHCFWFTLLSRGGTHWHIWSSSSAKSRNFICFKSFMAWQVFMAFQASPESIIIVSKLSRGIPEFIKDGFQTNHLLQRNFPLR